MIPLRLSSIQIFECLVVCMAGALSGDRVSPPLPPPPLPHPSHRFRIRIQISGKRIQTVATARPAKAAIRAEEVEGGGGGEGVCADWQGEAGCRHDKGMWDMIDFLKNE